MKGIIYYTDNFVDTTILDVCQKFIKQSGLPIVSCSLEPMDFGQNVVIPGVKRSYPTMILQIIAALELSTATYVFFCEHDILYHKSHFDFTPARDDIYYYNTNSWRWVFKQNYLSTYDTMVTLSGLCANRETLLKHFKYRYDYIINNGLDAINKRDIEPKWGRRFSYEPGTKKCSKGGITDECYETWCSDFPNIDIRHGRNLTTSPARKEEYRKLPETFKSTAIDKIEGWNLRELFVCDE